MRNSTVYRYCLKKLLDEEINQKRSRIRVPSSESATNLANLAKQVSYHDLIHLQSVCDRENSNTLHQHEKIQEKKLFRLRLRLY